MGKNPIITPVEKAVLIGVGFPRDQFPLSLSLAELERLTATAGARVVGTLTQNRERPDGKYFIGAGKVEELRNLVGSLGANLVVFDHEVSPSQIRNLEEAVAVKVIDRTELILDIFAQHARSREGKLQVELAQSTFLLTRLTGHGAAMSRLGGGIATRGPGETKLEYDRRRLRKNISQLNEAIEKVRRERHLKREKRHSSRILSAVLVGYTNAGKSTLLNTLTRAGVLTADQLFATLDPTVRRLYLPSGRTILVTDTVGFIQKLPHSLVAAFRATLEEVTEADLLLHVVDSACPYYEQQITAVYQVLEDIGGIAKPLITVFNKSDKLNEKVTKKILSKYKPAVAVSALRGTDLDKLLSTIDALLPGLRPAS
jgi:GTP-binding protein HflX